MLDFCHGHFSDASLKIHSWAFNGSVLRKSRVLLSKSLSSDENPDLSQKNNDLSSENPHGSFEDPGLAMKIPFYLLKNRFVLYTTSLFTVFLL